MAGVVPASSKQYFPSTSGAPLADGSIDVYLAGTLIRADTYFDRDLAEGHKNTNPITLDSRGECDIWLTPALLYKFVVSDADGVVQYTNDNVLGAGDIPTLQQITVDRFSGTGAQTDFTLSVTPGGENDTSVYVAGSYVQKNVYSVAGNVLTFAVAPASGTNNIEVSTTTLLDFASVSSSIAASVAAAATSATDAEASRDAIDNRLYPGTSATAPTTRPDGSAIEDGDRYINSADGYEYLRISGVWTSGADSAQSAAASAAEATTATAKSLFSTQTLGHSGSADGQSFNVTQSPTGEGADTYLHSGASDVWQGAGSVGELAAAEMISRASAPFSAAPVAAVVSWETLLQNGRGALNSARPKSRVFGRNLYAYVHGARNAGSGPTVTQAFADGPTKTGTATRVQITVNTQLFSIWASGYRPPAGTYTVDFQVRSNSGSDAAIRTGNSAQGFTARTAPSAAATWLHVQHQITSDGTTWASFVVTGDGTNTPDLLIDEVRIYPTVSTEVPAYSADPQGDDFMPALAWAKVRHIGRALDLTTSAVEGAGVLRVQGWPTVRTFSECTLIAIAQMDTAATNQQLLTSDYSTVLGTTNATVAITSSQADGALDFPGMTMLYAHNMAGQGAFPVAARWRDGERSAFLQTVEIATAASAFSSFQARNFRLGANAASDGTAYQSTFRWQGKIMAAAVYDRFLNDTQLAAEIEALKARVRAGGIELASMPAFMIAMGDSQTASFSGNRGPSWAVLQAVNGTHTPNLPMRNLAVGGKTRAQVVSEQLPVALTMIAQAKRVPGCVPVVCIFVGTNDQTAIIADPAGWWADTVAQLGAPIIAAGAEVIFGTPLPDGSLVGWETPRLALRTAMLAQPALTPHLYIADQGNPATTMGNPATVSDNTRYDPVDQRHVLGSGSAGGVGHAELATVWTPAIHAAIVSA